MTELPQSLNTLLMDVSARLPELHSNVDYLLTTKWRVLKVCHCLIGTSNRSVEEKCFTALQRFVALGPCYAVDECLEEALSVARSAHGEFDALLPSLSAQKRLQVTEHLAAIASEGGSAIQRAHERIAEARSIIRDKYGDGLLPGFAHRFEQAVAVLSNELVPENERINVAAAIIYLVEPNDVVPDVLGSIGMIDDDYAIRAALGEIKSRDHKPTQHWSERIASVWTDMPYLQGLNLERGSDRYTVSWLDRMMSFSVYQHALRSNGAVLVMLQPSVSCSPVHSIVTLIGVLVFEAATSSHRAVSALKLGQKYKFDRHVAVFDGISVDNRFPSWLRFQFRKGLAYAHPDFASRIVAVRSDESLSSADDFRSVSPGRDTLRRFFRWNAPIGPTLMAKYVVFVSSRRRVDELMKGLQSNGVSLLDEGITRFVGSAVVPSLLAGASLLVVPSLATVRLLLDARIELQAVLVDGVERLTAGRHDLPFIQNHPSPPALIVWSAAGYFPTRPPEWLVPRQFLHVSEADLDEIVNNEDESAEGRLRSIARLLKLKPSIYPVVLSEAETSISASLTHYVDSIRRSASLPDHVRFQILSRTHALTAVIRDVPAAWSSIRSIAKIWTSEIRKACVSLRGAAERTLIDLRALETLVIEGIGSVTEAFNSMALGIASATSTTDLERPSLRLVVRDGIQLAVSSEAIAGLGLKDVRSVMLRELDAFESCIVTGLFDRAQMRRLLAHTPSSILIVSHKSGIDRCLGVSAFEHPLEGSSIRASLNADPINDVGKPIHIELESPDESRWSSVESDDRVPCVVIRVVGMTECKILETDSRVFRESDSSVSECYAKDLRAENRVLLGSGAAGWSPAEEFTDAVVDAVRNSNPSLVVQSQAWRVALLRKVEREKLSVEELLRRLAASGVHREMETLERWLSLEKTSPISPRGVRVELSAMWPLIEDQVECTLEELVGACTRLRNLRLETGRTLLRAWKEGTVIPGLSESKAGELLTQLRSTIQAYEVISVTSGEFPRALMGWWISDQMADKYGLGATGNAVLEMPTVGSLSD
jgi:uncharacterized membrane protein YkvA (DUF1232 family)